MRIVAVADTHTFESDMGSLPDGDVFVHAGDIVRGGDLKELEGPAVWMRSLPHKHKVVVAGNHDWCFLRQHEAARRLLGEGITYLQDSGCVIDGVEFCGAPWQPEFGGWAYNLPRNGRELAEKWALIPSSCHVLITHGPPLGIGDQTSVSGRAGCEQLLAAVNRVNPLLHMFGHIHQDGGVFPRGNTVFTNVTTWECERGATVLDVDLREARVTPVSVPVRDPLHPD